MSDFGDDDMDIDAPTADDVQFSSNNTNAKGKRSAANLPIEAEDSLPWVEKYRPNTLSDVSGHEDIVATINKFVDSNRLPHLLLYGPPGTGKTSTVLALARRIYGASNMRQMVLELNASDDRGIDVVREQIKTFSSTKQIFSSGAFSSNNPGDSSNHSSISTFKLIILDEADAMTATAQMALRRIMEKYTAHTRFCILANYTHKLSPALLSRCTRFRFSPLPGPAIRRLVDRVVAEEHVPIQSEAVDALVILAKGDMRRALNVLQACHAAATPLRPPGAPPLTPAEQANLPRDPITTSTVYDCVGAPHPADIQRIRDTLLGNPDVAACLGLLGQLKREKGLALADVLSALADELSQVEVPAQVRTLWMEGLSEVEWRVARGGSEGVQMGGMVGVVRRGCELVS
ncbi:MAG: hypothetical protein M1821_008804 [Bathelium mastoideum]|nr:MAG: hypothetical protein M1821_008804 [Bathelium mastoideum]